MSVILGGGSLIVSSPPPKAATLARVIAFNRSSQVIPNGSFNMTLTNWTETVDTTNSFDPVAGLFTAPANGYYYFDACPLAASGSASFGLAVLVNSGGTETSRLQPGVVAGGVGNMSGLVQMIKNDVLRFVMSNFSGVAVTLFNNPGAPGANYLSIVQQP